MLKDNNCYKVQARGFLMEKSIESEVAYCPMEMYNLGDSDKKCLLRNQARCYCKNYKECKIYDDYKENN